MRGLDLVVVGLASVSGWLFGVPGSECADAHGATSERVVTDPDGIVSTRARWPVGLPLYVRVRPGQFCGDEPRELCISSELSDASRDCRRLESRWTEILPGPGTTWSDDMRPAGVAQGARAGVSFHYRVTLSAPDGQTLTLREDETELPVEIGGDLDDVLTAIELPDLDAALGTEVNASFYRYGWHSGGEPRLWLGTYTNCNGGSTKYPGICHILRRHPEVTFAVLAEVRHDGATVASTRAWWRGTELSVRPFEGMLTVDGDAVTFRALQIDDGLWTLRLRSDPETALRDIESAQYWQGDAVVPIRVTDSYDWEHLRQDDEGE